MRAFFILFFIVAAGAGGWFWHHAKSLPGAGDPAAQAKGPMGGPSRGGPGMVMGGNRGGNMGPMPVETAPVTAEDLPVTVSAVGTLSASESAGIRAEIAGVIRSINFSEGQPVKKGDSLIDIDDSLIQAALMRAAATHDVRKTTFGRSDKLRASGYVSRQAWEESKGSLQESQADIESARASLEKTKVTAPFDGVAGLRTISAGDYVQVGQMLTTLDAIDQMKLTFSVPEKSYGNIKPPQKISFSVDAWPDEIFAGEIYAISPRVDEASRNFDVKALIPNPDGRLRPGMFARIHITTDVRQGALMIPEEAIIPKNDESYVFVVRDGKAVLQKISTGLRLPGKVEVTGGLAAQEQVVTAGVMKIQDGLPVKATTP